MNQTNSIKYIPMYCNMVRVTDKQAIELSNMIDYNKVRDAELTLMWARNRGVIEDIVAKEMLKRLKQTKEIREQNLTAMVGVYHLGINFLDDYVHEINEEYVENNVKWKN